ncbi:MAG: hypothetical protein GY835_20455 [bacterium]|nr:hypothetical protein [bacterium]
MRERITLITILFFFCLSLGMAAHGKTSQWLHVRVVEGGRSDENVSVNLPLSMVSAILENVECDEFRDGAIRIDDSEFDLQMVNAILTAIVDAEDGEFVMIENHSRYSDEEVRVCKEKDELLVKVDEDGEKVNIRVPISVMKALVEGDNDNELDIVSALEELAKEGDTTLVVVEDGDNMIRVWVDSSMQGI